MSKNFYLNEHEYTIKTSTLPNSGFGAFTNVHLPKNTVLDYYRGQKLNPSQYKNLKNKAYVWSVKSKKLGNIYIDGQNESKSNWLRFLNDSRDHRNNIKPYQYRDKIFYKTMKDIYPGQELFVSYGDSYWPSIN